MYTVCTINYYHIAKQHKMSLEALNYESDLWNSWNVFHVSTRLAFTMCMRPLELAKINNYSSCV